MKNLLCIFMGGDRNLEEAFNAVRELTKIFVVKIFISKSATQIIGTEKIKSELKGCEVIVPNGEYIDVHKLSHWADVLVIPVLTLNGLSKIVNLMPDSLQINIAIGCLEKGIPVIVSRDSVFCSCYPEPSMNTSLYRKVEQNIAELKSLGITVSSGKNLVNDVLRQCGIRESVIKPSSAGKIFDDKKIINITSTTLGKNFASENVNVTIGSAGKVFASPVNKFGGIISDICNAFKIGDTVQSSECSSCGKCVERKKGSVAEVINSGADRIAAYDIKEVGKEIAPLIDHTLLKANATQEEIVKLCEEAKKYGFASVCVNPAYVNLCKQLLGNSQVKVCTVIGFPLGATTPTVKAIETKESIANGADEIDMVINIGALKSGNYQLVFDDIKSVRDASKGKILKVIIETAYLTKEEKIKACELAKEAGADFVKTSTGFGPSGATAEDIALMRSVVGPKLGVKASGGIRSLGDALKMVQAGATRIGASASVAIVKGDVGKGKY
ncbi:MAG: deoxyribose-phosphate aldolase [Bacteroidales bacterium]